MNKLISFLLSLLLATVANAQLADGIKIYKNGSGDTIVGDYNLSDIVSNSAGYWSKHAAVTNVDMNTNKLLNVGSLMYGLPQGNPVFTNMMYGCNTNIGLGTNVVGAVNTYSTSPAGVSWYVDATLGNDSPGQGTGPGVNAFKTVQYAIDSAGSGDTIYMTGTFILGSVTPGVPAPNLGPIYANKNQILLGQGTTIFDGGDYGYYNPGLGMWVPNIYETRCLVIQNGVIDGVQFYRGHGKMGGGYGITDGYGMFAHVSGSAIIRNCSVSTIAEDPYYPPAFPMYGSIYIGNGAIAQACTVNSIVPAYISTYYGVGMYLEGGATALDCNLSGNTAPPGCTVYGVGLHVGGDAVVNHCNIDNNSMGPGTCYGGGVTVSGVGISAGNFTHNSIAGNICQSMGAGMYVDVAGTANIEYCRFYNNGDTYYGISAGAGLYSASSGGPGSGSLTIDRCEFDLNYGAAVGGIAISANGSTINIRNSGISNGVSYAGGAGIYVPNTSVGTFVITNNMFANNTDYMFASQTANGEAILIEAAQSPAVFVDHCTFNGNEGTWRGGAINYMPSSGAGTTGIVIQCSSFSGNTVLYSTMYGATYGGAIYIYPDFGLIDRCYFANNRSRDTGGAISLYNAQAPGANTRIVNCLMVSNVVTHDDAMPLEGNALQLADGTVVRNCTFITNHNDDVAGVSQYAIFVNPGETVVLKNNIFYGNDMDIDPNFVTTYVGYNRTDDLWPIGSNYNVPYMPQFITASNYTYYLDPYSPLINMGEMSVDNGDYDLANNPRVRDNNVDLGCYEVMRGTPRLSVDTNGVLRVWAAGIYVDLMDVQGIMIDGVLAPTVNIPDGLGNTLHYKYGVLMEITTP